MITGNILKSAESALKLEQERLQKYKEFDEKTQALGQSSNKVMPEILLLWFIIYMLSFLVVLVILLQFYSIITLH